MPFAFELDYWDLARRLNQDIPRDALLRTFTDLHAEIFGIAPQAAAESAEYRTQAIDLLCEITGGTAADSERNWSALEERLRLCYRSAQAAMKAAGPPAPSATSPART